MSQDKDFFLNKGLKLLSIMVKEIVEKSNGITYKEVARRILKEQCFQKLEDEEELKEESNIKRRVYDALNVLISANVIFKEGRQVFKNNSTKLPINEKLIKIQKLKAKR